MGENVSYKSGNGKKKVILYLIYNKECEINDSGETTTS